MCWQVRVCWGRNKAAYQRSPAYEPVGRQAILNVGLWAALTSGGVVGSQRRVSTAREPRSGPETF